MTRNLTITETGDGFLITADARLPAPEFRDLVHALAHPDPYAGLSDDTRRRLDILAQAFGQTIDRTKAHWLAIPEDWKPEFRFTDFEVKPNGRGGFIAREAA